MPLNNQQRNIINPFAQEETEYSYDDLRNRFVLDAIHESYTNYFTLLPINKVLKISIEQMAQLGIERPVNNLTVTRDDLLAYEILYPQNCSSSAVPTVTDNDIQQIDLLKVPDVSYSKQKLSELVGKLETRGVLDLYLSDSSPTAILPENINNTGPTGHAAKLVAISPNHSNEYTKILRNSLDVENELALSNVESINNLSLTSIASSYVNNDNNIDIYDWRENCLPGDDTEKIYYNPIDECFYFTKRTDKVTSEDFDLKYRSVDGQLIPLVASAIKQGISEILKYTGRYSTTAAAFLYQNQLFNFLSHMDIRPGSRWMTAVKIESKFIERLDKTEQNSISYDEFEYTALEKAKILISPDSNKTAIKSLLKVESIVRYMPNVVATIARYAKQLRAEGIVPKQLNGIDLSIQRSILDSFIDNLSLAYLQNKKTINDEDIVEFCFSEGYNLEYFVVNGYIMTRGIGNKKFYKVPEDTEPPKTITNSFSRMTPTSFSIIKNSYEIYSDDSIRSDDSTKPWPIFFEDYIFPAVDLDYGKIKADKKEEERKRRRNSLYTKISELYKSGAEIEDNLRRINPDRYPYYEVTTIFTDLDCDTAQFAVMKEALKFWQALNGKTKVRNLIRQSVLTVRNQLINESLEKSILSGALDAEQNPRLFIREIEKSINEQIFCGLDVMGNIIETQFLDSKSMDPLAKAGGKAPGLGSPLTIELKLPKGVGRDTKSVYESKQDLYEKMVTEIILGFLTTIAMGIIKDVVKAALGCGPNEDVLNDTLRNIRFGFLDLNEYLLDVDIVEVAKEANLVNVTRSQVDGQEVVTKEDPTVTQITNLISDVSKMCTPSELDRLTFGEADHVLYELILETVENGIITFDIEEGADETREEQIDPTVYENLDFSVETIKNFFLGLGDAMRDNNAEELAKFSFSPLEAYCEHLDPDAGRLNLKLSIEQIEDQYNSLAQDKINKINEMCDLLRGLENIQREIQRLVDSLPLMEHYNSMLTYVANLSNSLYQTLAELWNDIFDTDVKKTQDPEYNIYLTNLGQQLFFRVGSLINRTITACEQVAAADNTEQFFYQSPLPSRQYKREWSPLTLPFPPPAILKPASGTGLAARTATKRDEEAAYALRSGPYELRQALNAITKPPPGEDDVFNYYRDLFMIYLDWEQTKDAVTPSDRWISSYSQADNARIRLSVNSPEQGGVFLSRQIKRNTYTVRKPYDDFNSHNKNLTEDNIPQFSLSETEPGIYETVVVAQYIPEIGDVEPAKRAVNYYQLLNGIGTGTGGPLDAGAFTNSIRMPSRNNSDITKIINNSFQGVINYEALGLRTLPTGYLASLDEDARDESDAFEDYIDTIEAQLGIEEAEAEVLISDLSPDIDSICLSNWTQYIDQQLDVRYTKTEGRQYLTRYMKFINDPVFTPNDDVCITMEDMDVASSIVMSIQSRIQIFLLNVCHLTRVFPNWNSFGTTKVITDYLYRKINSELSKRELVNIIYSKLDVFQKVYADTPQREGLEEEDRFTENDMQIDENISPDEFLRFLVEQVYVRMLENTNSSIKRTAYAGSGEKSVYRRYRRFLVKFYRELDAGLRAGNNFGLSDQEKEDAILFIGQSLLPGGNLSDLGLFYGSYYYPLSFIISLHLVVADSLVNIARNFDTGYAKTMIEKAAADDNLLSAVTGEPVSKYSEDLRGMPYTYIRETLGSEVTFFSRTNVRERVEDLSIDLGIDREFFIPHLRYVREIVKSAALDAAPDGGPPSPTTPPVAILYRFISGVLSGDLAPLSLVLPSYLNLTNLVNRGLGPPIVETTRYLVAEDSPYLSFFNSYTDEDNVNRATALDVAAAMLNMYYFYRNPFGAGKIPEKTREKFELEEVLRL